MNELLSLRPIQLDAIREVANIGAGHAATALSQMTGQTIMINVPTINVAAMEEVPPNIIGPEEPVAAVLMSMLGDLTGRTLLVFPMPTATRLAELLLRRPHPEGGLGALRVEVRGRRGQQRVSVVLGAIDRAAVAAGAVAAVAAIEIAAPRRREGAFGLSDAGLPTADLLVELARRGVKAARFLGSDASASSW